MLANHLIAIHGVQVITIVAKAEMDGGEFEIGNIETVPTLLQF